MVSFVLLPRVAFCPLRHSTALHIFLVFASLGTSEKKGFLRGERESRGRDTIEMTMEKDIDTSFYFFREGIASVSCSESSSERPCDVLKRGRK